MSDPFLTIYADDGPTSVHDASAAHPAEPAADEANEVIEAEVDDWLSDDPPELPRRDWKAEARLALERWLDTQPEQLPDQPEDSLPEADATACDLLKVVGELTALKQEVRGLGRSSARLAASAGQSTERLVETLQALADDMRAAGRETVLRARTEAERPMLLELGDVREALREMVSRANATPAAKRSMRFWRPAPPPPPPAPIPPEALAVLIRRLDTMLERHGVATLGAVGDVFEASRMNVAGVSREHAVGPGQVSAVVRVGFLAGSTLLRPAEVMVEAEEQT